MKAANLDPEDPNVRTAVFGQEVQDFLQTHVGGYLIDRAKHELQVAIDQLKVAPADKLLAIVQLQERIRALDNFHAWLGDAVQAGLTAVAIIDGEEGHGQEE